MDKTGVKLFPNFTRHHLITHTNKCCPARQAECSKCKMVGHHAAMCKTKTRGGAANSSGRQKREAENNKYLEEKVLGDTDDDDEALCLFAAEDSEGKWHSPVGHLH